MKLAELEGIYVLCECCGEIQRFLETAPTLVPNRRDWLDKLREEEVSVLKVRDNMAVAKQDIRFEVNSVARTDANAAIEKDDNILTPLGFHPDDAKLILTPYNYIVFDGMRFDHKDGAGISSVGFVDNTTEGDAAKVAVRNGYVKWATVRMDPGSLKVEQKST
jgi:predicted Holliday junction resolvase-like endonuclease